MSKFKIFYPFHVKIVRSVCGDTAVLVPAVICGSGGRGDPGPVWALTWSSHELSPRKYPPSTAPLLAGDTWTYLPVSLCPYHFCTTVQVSAALHPHVQIAPFSLTMGIIILFPATLHSLKRSKLLYIMQGWPLARARNNIATCCCCAVALNV